MNGSAKILRKAFWTITLLFLPAISIACEASYSSATDLFTVPCIHIDSQVERYSATFKRNNNLDFSLTENQLRTLRDAYIEDVQVITSPFLAVVVFFYLNDGCTAEYQAASQATVDYATRTINITVKTYNASPPNVGCTMAAINATRAFALNLGYSFDGNNTYTIKANNFSKSFTRPPL